MTDKSLTKVEKTICKVCLIHVVIAKLLTELDIRQDAEEKNPAVQHCTVLIDELLEPQEDERRDLIVARLNKARARITKKAESIDLGSGIVGALEVLTSGMIKYRTGTRLAYIIENFETNIEEMRKAVPTREAPTKKFKNILIKELNGI